MPQRKKETIPLYCLSVHLILFCGFSQAVEFNQTVVQPLLVILHPTFIP